MPRLTVHRREYALWTEPDGYRCACWIEYCFDPVHAAWGAPRTWVSDDDFFHVWTGLPAVEIEAPLGARLVERTPAPVKDGERRPPELRCVWPRQSAEIAGEEWGLDAEICYRLAQSGERGFSMAKRRQDDGPTLFDAAPEAAAPEVGAYGPARRGGGAAMAIADLADDGPRFERTGAAIDRAERLERAIREALPWLVEMGGRPPMPLTAHNILRAALEAAEAPGGAGEAA